MNFLADPVIFFISWLRNLLSGWGIAPDWVQFILYGLGAVLLPMMAMFSALFFIWFERKMLGRIQDRTGPNRVGPFGLFQTIADMLKIFIKEYITPTGADVIPYNLAPVLVVAGVILVWAVLPFTMTVYGVNLNVGVIYIVAVGAIGELGIILAGWSSRNKYALLGGFRAVALLISYEIPLVISLLIPVLLAGSMGLNDIVKAQDLWFIIQAPLAALVFLISSIAENGRAPFDLAEADSEIVAGFNIEYSGLKFGMFFVADFLHTFTTAMVFTTVFLGGWRGPWVEQWPVLGFVYFIAKAFVIEFLIVLVRGSLPRFRIDQMMNLNWKILTPMMLALVIVTALAAKIIPSNFQIVRVVILFILNGAILMGTQWLLRQYVAQQKPSLVAQKNDRAVAQP